MVEDVAQILLRETIRRLSPDGWTVETRESPSPSWFHIQIDHELSSGFSWGLRRDNDDHEARFESFMQNPEFAAIRTRPADVPHAPLIRSIRGAAGALDWPPSVVENLADILEGHGLLTPSEGAWLRAVGGVRWKFAPSP